MPSSYANIHFRQPRISPFRDQVCSAETAEENNKKTDDFGAAGSVYTTSDACDIPDPVINDKDDYDSDACSECSDSSDVPSLVSASSESSEEEEGSDDESERREAVRRRSTVTRMKRLGYVPKRRASRRFSRGDTPPRARAGQRVTYWDPYWDGEVPDAEGEGENVGCDDEFDPSSASARVANHMYHAERRRSKSRSAVPSRRAATGAPRQNGTANRNRLVQFQGTIASSPCSILVDCGASRDFISQEKVEKLKLPTVLMDTPFGVSMADGRTVNSGRVVRDAEIRIGPLTIKRDLHVINMSGLEVIFGKPFLYDYNPNLDWLNNSMELVHDGTLFSLNPDGDHRESIFGDARATHAEVVKSVAKGERCFAVYVTKDPQHDHGQEDPHQQFVLDQDGAAYYVSVAPVLEVSKAGQLDASTLEQMLKPTMSDTTQLSAASSARIREFIRRHPDVATESEAPSKPREVEGELVYHTITEVPGSRPPFKQPYRMSSAEIKELKKMLDDTRATRHSHAF